MPSTQELTRRIKSVKSTRKITRAMQMISAAKMRKSQLSAFASRTYADLAQDLIRTLGGARESDSHLLKSFPKATKLGVVLVTTNKGLVGSFNTNVLNKLRELELGEPELLSEVVAIGKKGRDNMVRSNKNLIAEFPKQDATQHIKEVYPIVRTISAAYATGEYKRIVVVYNHFVSTLVQKPTVKELLPFQEIRDERGSGPMVIYEPTKKVVFHELLPRIIESQIYQAILESDASEHSARMLMMKNATDAAGDLIDDLTLTFNQLRQSKITTELSEITAGKIALEK